MAGSKHRGGGRDWNEIYPRAGSTVDGRLVRPDVPNTSSIDGYSSEYEILRGIRSVRMSLFTLDEAGLPTDPYTLRLAEAIRESKEINPLIVGVDKEGPWILEGSHRYDALKVLKAKAFPAMVVIYTEEL